MADRAGIQTPYDNAVCPTPSGSMDGGGTSGGFDLVDGQKETANSQSGLPMQPTTVALQGGDPGPGGQVDMPPVASPGTIHTSKP